MNSASIVFAHFARTESASPFVKAGAPGVAASGGVPRPAAGVSPSEAPAFAYRGQPALVVALPAGVAPAEVRLPK